MKKTLALAILFSIVSGCSSFTPVVDNQQHITRKFLTDSPRPTVIIAHGCDGNENPSYAEWAREINSWGYNTVVADSFQFRGYATGTICDYPTRVLPVTRAQDLVELADYVRTQPWHKGNIAVIGFSHGGSTVMNIANSDQKSINATVAYYPSCIQSFNGVFEYRPKIPIQMHLAENDDWTPVSQCYYVPESDKFLYKGATHAFDMKLPNRVYLGHTMKYDKNSDTIAKQRTKEFFSTTLK